MLHVSLLFPMSFYTLKERLGFKKNLGTEKELILLFALHCFTVVIFLNNSPIEF